MDDWRRALAERDLDGMLKHYADDVRFFDAVPPFQHQGAAAYRGSWEAMFPFLPERIQSTVEELSITASGDVGFASCLQSIRNADTGEPATCGWVRVTVCYRKQGGKWRVAHEHVSVPFDPQTGQAAFVRER